MEAQVAQLRAALYANKMLPSTARGLLRDSLGASLPPRQTPHSEGFETAMQPPSAEAPAESVASPEPWEATATMSGLATRKRPLEPVPWMQAHANAHLSGSVAAMDRLLYRAADDLQTSRADAQHKYWTQSDDPRARLYRLIEAQVIGQHKRTQVAPQVHESIRGAFVGISRTPGRGSVGHARQAASAPMCSANSALTNTFQTLIKVSL